MLISMCPTNESACGEAWSIRIALAGVRTSKQNRVFEGKNNQVTLRVFPSFLFRVRGVVVARH